MRFFLAGLLALILGSFAPLMSIAQNPSHPDMQRAMALVAGLSDVTVVHSGLASVEATFDSPLHDEARLEVPEGRSLRIDRSIKLRSLYVQGELTIGADGDGGGHPDPDPDPDPTDPTILELIQQQPEPLRTILLHLYERTLPAASTNCCTADGCHCGENCQCTPGNQCSPDCQCGAGQMSVGSDAEPIVLEVETIVTDVHSRIVFDARSGPIRVIFRDTGPIEDPFVMGRGLITMGEKEFIGTEVTPVCTTSAMAGDTTLTFAEPVTGWQVGDKLVLPGTSIETYKAQDGNTYQVDEDDVVYVESVADDRLSVTLTAPLQFDHPATFEQDGLTFTREMFVANIAPRGVDFTSQNWDIPRRGHIMAMRDNQSIGGRWEYCSFRGLGRTNKLAPLTDPDGVGGGRENARARYSWHAHLQGANPNSGVEQVVGCISDNNPGWAFTDHGSNCLFRDCVSYDCIGSHYTCENGHETLDLENCYAIRSRSPATGRGVVHQAKPVSDWGTNGHGFWSHGGQVRIRGLTVTGCPASAVTIMGEPFKLLSGAEVRFSVANLRDPEQYTGTATTIATSDVPQDVERVRVWGCPSKTLEIWGLNPNKSEQPTVGRSRFADIHGESLDGFMGGYTSHGDFVDFTHVNPHRQRYYNGEGARHNGGGGGNTFTRFRSYGTNIGMRIWPQNLGNRLEDCTTQSITGIWCTGPSASFYRRAEITGHTFLAPPPEGVATAKKFLVKNSLFKRFQQEQPVNVLALMGDFGFTRDGGAGGWNEGLGPRRAVPDVVQRDLVLIDGKELFYQDEHPDFPIGQQWKDIPSIFAGLTSGQLWEQHRVAVNGRVPPTLTPLNSQGLAYVSDEPPSVLPELRINKTWNAYSRRNYQQVADGTGFVLKVQDSSGAFIENPPVDLPAGDHVLRVTADGVERGVLVRVVPGGSFPAEW